MIRGAQKTPSLRVQMEDAGLYLKNIIYLVGGFNPSEKICSSKWVYLPQIGVKIKNI